MANIGLMLAVALLATVFLTVANAKAEAPTPVPGGVAVTIVQYPTHFEWGQVLDYKFEVRNISGAKKNVLLNFAFANTVASLKGGGPDIVFSVRHLRLAVGKTIAYHFRVVAPVTSGQIVTTQKCLTVWANVTVGAFTCANSPVPNW